MTIKEFFKLPRKRKQPNQKIKDEIKKLRDSIEVVESDGVKHESHRCCGKVAFDTKVEALQSIGNYRKNSKRPFRAYRCQMGKWHLSGTPKKKFKQ